MTVMVNTCFSYFNINFKLCVLFIVLYNFSESGISRTIQIKDLLRVHRNKLQFELEPMQVISALSKSKAIQKGSLHCASSSCTEKINGILSMVKDGSTDLVESFVAALKDLGYRDIVELIDPTDVHTKAGKYCFNRF